MLLVAGADPNAAPILSALIVRKNFATTNQIA